MSRHQDILSPREIAAWEPSPPPHGPGQEAAPLVAGLREAGQWSPDQLAGRRWPIGCVALEITQRCNLDCTLCYLSEHSEAVRDLPLAEVFHRMDMIRRHYGPDTDVQVTGGDPTLRRRDELVAIVRRIHGLGMRASLFTNGIKATRDLLAELAANGLVDVAFHVDATQNRRGFDGEPALNELRQTYIEQARGLGLSVFFNTTVFAGNFDEIPAIVRFFRRNADVVRLASFQLQADAGRGVLRQRPAYINRDSVAGQISAGAGIPLNFDTARIGHPGCNRYAMTVEANGRLYDVFDDPAYISGAFERLSAVKFDRLRRRRAVAALARAAVEHRDYWIPTLRYLARKTWQMKADLVKGRGRVNKLSFFIHDFMDADRLERDRCKSCIFMVATSDGPLSMCVHNAKRDNYLLRAIALEGSLATQNWDPLTGTVEEAGAARQPPRDPQSYPLKYKKGRTRALTRPSHRQAVSEYRRQR